MGYLAPARAVIGRAMARAMAPPPPPDVFRWVCEHLKFDDSSPMPGRFDAARFPMVRRILECFSPEHSAREVTLVGSAQILKTETILNGTLAAWFDLHPRNALVVHPTSSAAAEWVRSKWMPLRRRNERMQAVFGGGRNGGPPDSLTFQETLNRDASLRVVSAGSPSDLSGTTRPLILMDDVSKFETTPMGDPETLATSRAAAFEDAKIGRTSTPTIHGACRITHAFRRGTQERWEVPCPHCDSRQPLLWENFEPNIDPADLGGVGFTCRECGCIITQRDRERIVGRGAWVAVNPAGDHPSFWLWRAYLPFRSWESIATEWLAAKGDPGREQTFHNDVLGLAFNPASDAPDWMELRNRVEADEAMPTRGVFPAGLPIATIGVDCQQDRIEWQLVAFGRNDRAHVVDYGVIPHHIGEDEAQEALDALLARRWRGPAGSERGVDRLAIDGGTYTDDVWAWAKRHPWRRAVIVKGASSGQGPLYAPMKFDRRKDGAAKRSQKRAFTVNVSALKATIYADLRKTTPDERGHQSFGRGLGDAYFRGLASERRVLRRNRFGVMESVWELVEPAGRNEALDTRVYADVAARLEGYRTWGDREWYAAEARLADRPADAAPAPATPAPARSAPPPPPPAPATADPTGVRAAFAKLNRR